MSIDLIHNTRIDNIRHIRLENFGDAAGYIKGAHKIDDISATHNQRDNNVHGCKSVEVFVLDIINGLQIALVFLEFLHFQLYQEGIKAFVYSVKLKLEIHILSKLVNVVQGNQKSRAMTLEFIDSSAIAGQARAEVRREMREPQYNSSNEKKASVQKRNEEGNIGPLDSASSSQQTDEKDEISRVRSTTSIRTERTKGRESDVLYADFVRSMS